MHAEGLAYFDLERTWVRARTLELYKPCLHVVRAGTLACMTGTYRMYPDLDLSPPAKTDQEMILAKL